MDETMNTKYHHLWILFQEMIARRSRQKKEYVDQKALLQDLLADMAILEAEAVLED